MAVEIEGPPSKKAAMRALRQGCEPTTKIINDEVITTKSFKKGAFITQVQATLMRASTYEALEGRVFGPLIEDGWVHLLWHEASPVSTIWPITVQAGEGLCNCQLVYHGAKHSRSLVPFLVALSDIACAETLIMHDDILTNH